MADERQRELQRQAASGDVEAGAKLLLERVRSGEPTEERLRLAAYLSLEAAVVALEAFSLEGLAPPPKARLELCVPS